MTSRGGGGGSRQGSGGDIHLQLSRLIQLHHRLYHLRPEDLHLLALGVVENGLVLVGRREHLSWGVGWRRLVVKRR